MKNAPGTLPAQVGAAFAEGGALVGALVGGGTPSGVGNANWGCDVGSSGSGCEHF